MEEEKKKYKVQVLLFRSQEEDDKFIKNKIIPLQ